ncbi:MAG: outer membrane protein assembly factor BamD [Rickettsiales bacterium]|nr:MAG: outer membrane protein assembly factor BamD [Rickettsiales bacterium]
MKKIFILLLLFLSACVEKEKVVVSYNEAMQQLQDGTYMFAAENFEKLDDEYPFTEDAKNGLIMSAYSYYKAKEYDESVRVIDYFIKNNPVNDNVSYMYYLKGLNYEARNTSVTRARDIMEIQKDIYLVILSSFPNSIYVDDVKTRLNNINVDLSYNDLIIGNWYFDNRNYIGAMNHYKAILREYPTPQTEPEALYRLVELHDIFNLKVDALQYYVKLKKKYNDNEWTEYANEIVEKYAKN